MLLRQLQLRPIKSRCVPVLVACKSAYLLDLALYVIRPWQVCWRPAEATKDILQHVKYSLRAALNKVMWCRSIRKPLKQMPRLVQLQTAAVDTVSRKYVKSVV